MKYAIEKLFFLKGIVSWDVMHTFLLIDSQVFWNCEHFDLWYVTVILTLTLSADFQMFWRTTVLSVDSIWFRREVYSKSLVGPLAPGSLESAESYLYFAIDKWWQNTVLYSDTPLQQVLNENVVKIKINTSKRPNSKLSEIICWYPNWSHETIPFFREDSSWTSWA